MAKLTPMMQQYTEIKEKCKYCLLFYRLGDFYELFFEDAILASKELGITLTARECGLETKAPMCGVPHHSVEKYIGNLIEKGYSVAMCEQSDEIDEKTGIVKRDIIRVVSAGTTIDITQLDETKNNYVMSLYQDKSGIGFAYCDVTTGIFYTGSIDNESFLNVKDEVGRILPKEIIVNDAFLYKDEIFNIFNIKVNTYYNWTFEYDIAYTNICNNFKVINLNGIGIENDILCICSSGALLGFLKEMQKTSLQHINSIKKVNYTKNMMIDIASRRNLELTETLRDRSKKGTLIWVIDKTKTSMGARLLRDWLNQPLIIKEDIFLRQDSVKEFKDNLIKRKNFRDVLSNIYDIERIMSKIIYKTANGRDLLNLRNSFRNLPEIKNLISDFTSKLNMEIFSVFDDLEDLYLLIESSISEDCSIGLNEGDLIKLGFNSELDEFKKLKNNQDEILTNIEKQEIETTGIKNLKISYNKVFGYFIQITNSNKALVPEHYIRKQMLSNCERFIIPELKKIGEEILLADDKIIELENKLFISIRNKIANNIERIQFTSSLIATLDVIQSLAEVADENNYIKPNVTEDGTINIIKGRHPVIEKLTNNAFIPNDTYLNNSDNKLSVITGPNMAGKSTYMRQTALIILLTQIGSYVPAEYADITIVDRIFTRIGASDDLGTGQSTFMIEMSEVANILNSATKNSLLILDEIGRGTSTFDGLSIAWSVLEYIANTIHAKTLFSTHYHELTELETKVVGVKNYYMKIKKDGDDITFLRELERGSSNYSYGVHVAKIAGVPNQVLQRANELLNILNDIDISKNDSGLIK